MFTLFKKNFLTQKECEEIILFGNSLELQQSETYSKNGSIQNNTINKRHLTFIPPNNFPNLENKILDFINSLNVYKNSIYTKIDYFAFNKYIKTDFLKYHSDGHAIKNMGATLTFIFQLNDDYVGGDIVYKIDGIEHTIEKSIGSVFIFDSNIEHQINEITDGIRYSLNCWPFLKIQKKSLY